MSPRPRVINAGGASPGSSVAFIIFAIVALAILLATSITVVPPGHRGVAVTLGNVSPNYLSEGIHLKMPFITHVVDFPIKQITQQGETEVFSADLQNIKVRYNVFYRVPEAKVVELYRNYSGGVDQVYPSLIEPRLQETLKQATADSRAEDLAKSRESLKLEVLSQLRKALGELITIEDVTITNLQLSPQLEQAIEQKVIREQEALAKKFELEKAQKDAEITIVEAKAEAESVRIKGEALKVSPEVVQFEIAQKWDGKAPQSVVTTTGGANVLLPLK